MGFFNGCITFISSLSSSRRIRKTKKQIIRANELERNIAQYDAIEASQLFPLYQWVGNALVSGGGQDERNDIILQYCRQAVSFSNSVVVLHENNSTLVQKIKNEFSAGSNIVFIDDAHPYYEPFFRLSTSEILSLATKVGEKTTPIDVKSQRAIKAIADLLRHMVGAPYIRMMATCPISNLYGIIQKLEDSGKITATDSKEIRRNIDEGDADSAVLFLERLVSETPFLAGNSQLCNSTSVRESISLGSIIVINFQSSARIGALALLLSEIEKSAISTQKMSVILDASTDYNNMILDSLYKLRLPWAVSCQDVFQLSGGKQDNVKNWLALSNRAIIYRHPEISADAIASVLGSYKKIEETETTATDNSIGKFGFHHGDNRALAVKNIREQRVFSEDIKDLRPREFYLLDNNYSTICRGTLL